MTPLLGSAGRAGPHQLLDGRLVGKGLVPAHYVSLLGGLLIIGLYYMIARITFPQDPDEWPDYDAYYFEHRKWVLGGAMLCNIIAIAVF